MRAVVVGASSGLGRCIGVGLGQRGAQVALLARRHDLLLDAAKEAGPGTLAIACDVTDPSSGQAALARSSLLTTSPKLSASTRASRSSIGDRAIQLAP